MTTTAHEDQYLAAPEPVRQPYDTVAILRRNIADLEVALRAQTELKERAEAEVIQLQRWKEDQLWIWEDVDAYARKRTTLGKSVCETALELMHRAEAAEAELAKLAQQKPIKYLYRVIDCFGHDVLRDDPRDATIIETIPLYAATVPIPAPAVPAAHDMVITNIVNAEIWVQGGKVYARCANTSEGTGVFVFDGKHFGVTADTWVLMINLLQSAEPNNNAAADRLLENES